jgi:hypothetical protein
VVETVAPEESNRLAWLGQKGVADGDLLKGVVDTSYYVHVFQEWYLSVKFWMHANRRNPVAKCQGPNLWCQQACQASMLASDRLSVCARGLWVLTCKHLPT